MSGFTWATGGGAVVVEPSAGLKLSGYVSGNKPTAGNLNWLFQQLGILSTSVLEMGSPAITYNQFGQPVSATDGAETYTFTYGAFGMLAAASDGTTIVTINRNIAGNATGFTTTP